MPDGKVPAALVEVVRKIEALGLAREQQANALDFLRIGWNGRGIADQDVIDASLASQMGGTAAGPYINNLERALAALDWKT